MQPPTDESSSIQVLLNLLWAPLSGFIIWVTKSMMEKPSRVETRQLIDDKLKDIYTMQAVLKDDLKDINIKLDKIIDSIHK